ncbi:MAG: hypothetical protein SGJ20_06050 [Planctomycetota bacterium]|nr:hypothetical protein [Planctomycetota bacterium]
MALTSPRHVTSGYFRNHLYVLLGLNVLVCLVAFSGSDYVLLAPLLVAAVASYVGAACWLYEKSLAGIISLVIVAVADLVGAWLQLFAPVANVVTTSSQAAPVSPIATLLLALDPLLAGLLLGSTAAAMFLGHWYLNTPTMELAPLNRLLNWMALAVALRAVACAVGLGLLLYHGDALPNLYLLALRWIAGIVGMVGVIWMTKETLKIPNTQSATGILYVGVILTFLGELMSQLLSQQSAFPV